MLDSGYCTSVPNQAHGAIFTNRIQCKIAAGGKTLHSSDRSVIGQEGACTKKGVHNVETDFAAESPQIE